MEETSPLCSHICECFQKGKKIDHFTQAFRHRQKSSYLPPSENSTGTIISDGKGGIYLPGYICTFNSHYVYNTHLNYKSAQALRMTHAEIFKNVNREGHPVP